MFHNIYNIIIHIFIFKNYKAKKEMEETPFNHVMIVDAA